MALSLSEKANELVEKGMGIKEAADKVGISAQTVYQHRAVLKRRKKRTGSETETPVFTLPTQSRTYRKKSENVRYDKIAQLIVEASKWI